MTIVHDRHEFNSRNADLHLLRCNRFQRVGKWKQFLSCNDQNEHRTTSAFQNCILNIKLGILVISFLQVFFSFVKKVDLGRYKLMKLARLQSCELNPRNIWKKIKNPCFLNFLQLMQRRVIKTSFSKNSTDCKKSFQRRKKNLKLRKMRFCDLIDKS